MPRLRFNVEVTYPLVGGPGLNTWHYRTGNVLDSQPADVQSARDQLEEFYTSLAAFLPSSVTHRLLPEAIDIDSDTYVPVPDPWTIEGNVTSEQLLPARIMLTVTWRTTDASRRGFGRNFLGPFGESQNEANGTPDEALRAGVLAAAQTLIATGDDPDNDGAFGVYSRADDLLRDFVSANVRNEWSTLRSRSR